MWLFVLTTGCLFDRATYEARLAELTDEDGDGYSEVEGDCDDALAEVSPEAPERCNGEDDDCDGDVDEAADVVDAAWFADADGDGLGGGAAVVTCEPPAGMVALGGDCDDTDSEVLPGASERCNEADDDCDGEVDEAGEVATRAWYPDGDHDGFGAGTPIASCPDPGGASLADGDCDDTDPDVNPGAEETCNGGDDDCNGAVDDAPAITWYLDRDGDGFGDDGTTYLVCTPPPGYAAEGGDCDDLDEDRHPGAPEVCEDGEDADCDGLEATCGLGAGEADASDMSARFFVSGAESYVARTVAAGGDLDGDGFDDLIVSRPGRGGLIGSLACLPGREELYLGDLDLDLVSTRVDGVGASSAFGFALDAGEDTDADGTDDVLVSALYEDRVYLFTDGAALLRGGLDSDDADVTLVGPGNDASFGVSVALLGDLDADGWGDWLVGDYLYQASGAAFLYYGTGTGGTIAVGDAGVVVLASSRDRAQAGQRVADLGDLDGDGQSEFVVADNKVTSTGELSYGHVYPGDGSRLASGDLVDAPVLWSGAPADLTFAAVAAVGDLDRDGRGDAAFSAPGANDGRGAVYVVLGSPVLAGSGTLAGVADVVWMAETADRGMGASLSGPGDLDGDGYPDLAAGSARHGSTPGSVLVFLGGPSLGATYSDADAFVAITGASSEAEGVGLAGEADVNGDGAADLLLSAWDAGAASGQAWLSYGRP